jgi:hypothetical protein
MNLRPAAALAAVVWYLIVPPDHPEAPLASWNRLGVYDTATECRDAETKLRNLTRGSQYHALPQKGTGSLTAQAICVRSDDPRLEEN